MEILTRVFRKEQMPSSGIMLCASFAFKVLMYRTKENSLFYGNTSPFLTIENYDNFSRQQTFITDWEA